MIIVQQRFTRADVVNNRWITYVFGDNDQRTGFGGQAHACREQPNTIGIRTKKLPAAHEGAYYTDAEYKQNIAKIGADIDAVQMLLEQGNIVVFPADGIGTGRACLRIKAPETFAYLNNRIYQLQDKYRPIEDARGLSVNIFDPTAYKIVPLKPNSTTLDNAKNMLARFMRASGVDVAESAVRMQMRRLYKEMNGIEDDTLEDVERS